MKLIIDIPEDNYKRLMEYDGVIDDFWLEAIMNGTPLPKGHGRLIDADALDTSILQAGFAYAITRRELRYTAGDIRQKIANADTIIEADRSEE